MTILAAVLLTGRPLVDLPLKNLAFFTYQTCETCLLTTHFVLRHNYSYHRLQNLVRSLITKLLVYMADQFTGWALSHFTQPVTQ